MTINKNSGAAFRPVHTKINHIFYLEVTFCDDLWVTMNPHSAIIGLSSFGLSFRIYTHYSYSILLFLLQFVSDSVVLNITKLYFRFLVCFLSYCTRFLCKNYVNGDQSGSRIAFRKAVYLIFFNYYFIAYPIDQTN